MIDPTGHILDFFASMTVCPSDVRKIRAHVAESGARVDPLRNLLITPLFANRDTLTMMREMAGAGAKVMFDSGGYYVQTGKVKYEELYMPLLAAYLANPWADVYALPDHVPTTQDSREIVDRKVRDTVDFSTLFFQELPDALKERAMPIVQGHHQWQVEYCLKAYISLGVRHIGFGSFGTTGKSGGVNVTTSETVRMAKHVVAVAHAHGIKVHLFGLGVPALLAMIKGIGADSFDSSSWLKAAGFGQVFLPFTRAYSISHASTNSELQQGIRFEAFNEMRHLTQHHCDFCCPAHRLQEKKMYRATHNLVVLQEAVTMVNGKDYARIQQIYANASHHYRREYEKWLQ